MYNFQYTQPGLYFRFNSRENSESETFGGSRANSLSQLQKSADEAFFVRMSSFASI